MEKLYSGVVQKGAKRGAALGFPTANIPLDDKTVSGIYAARIHLRERDAPYMAAVYADSARGVLEAHVLNFNDELYGLKVSVELLKKIREVQRFDNDDDLKGAIARDVEAVREYFHV